MDRSWVGRESIHVFSFVVAFIATTGSLWFSLGLGLTPCDLCWYQRILMYPLVPILAASLIRRDDVSIYALSLAIPGFTVSLYHNYLQLTPAEGLCTSEIPCSVVQYSIYGVTIPQMSLSAFSLIIIAFLLPVVMDE